MESAPNSEVRQHGIVAKILHWGFIIVFAYAIIKQIEDIGQLSDRALLQFEVIFALGFLLLLAVRFVYMRATMPSALPAQTNPMIKLMARLGHLTIYISLALIALSGLAIAALYSSSGPESVSMEAALFVHETSVTLAYLAIGLHICAALFHRLKGDGIWSSMVPFFKEPN